MTNQSRQISLSLIAKYISIAFALIVLIDTYWPGTSYHSIIENIETTYEPHFNAGGAGHYSHALVTSKHRFYIDEKTKESLSIGENIDYRISLLFKEVQDYATEKESFKSSSLRLFTGTITPLLAIIIMLFSFKMPEKLSILVFVFQAGLLADAIYLIY